MARVLQIFCKLPDSCFCWTNTVCQSGQSSIERECHQWFATTWRPSLQLLLILEHGKYMDWRSSNVRVQEMEDQCHDKKMIKHNYTFAAFDLAISQGSAWARMQPDQSRPLWSPMTAPSWTKSVAMSSMSNNESSNLRASGGRKWVCPNVSQNGGWR